MTLTFTGDMNGKGRRFGIVVSRFSKVVKGGKGIGAVLLEGCLGRLREAGVPATSIAVVWTPGAFELPLAADALIRAASGRGETLHGVIALGCIVRGDTPHFDYVAGESARGIATVSLTARVPVLNGILTCDTDEQALARAGGSAGHKGIEAAEAALEMATALERVREWNPQL